MKSGPFRRVEDLLAIKGITKQRLEKIRPYVENRQFRSEKIGDAQKLGAAEQSAARYNA